MAWARGFLKTAVVLKYTSRAEDQPREEGGRAGGRGALESVTPGWKPQLSSPNAAMLGTQSE